MSTAAMSSSSASSVSGRRTPTSWDPQDDTMLRYLKETQKLGWKEIASHFPNRTTNACQFRWRRLVSGTLRTPSSSSSASSSPSPLAYPQQSGYAVQPNASSTSSPLTTTQPLQPLANPQIHSGQPVSQIHHRQQLPPSASYPQSQHRHLRHQLSAPAFNTNTNPGYPPPHQHQQQQQQQQQPQIPQYSRQWSKDEDELIMSRTDLHLDELSLLMAGRSEAEISQRRNELLSYHQRHRSSSSSKSHRQPSSMALPPLREYTSMNQLPSISFLSQPSSSSSPFNNNILPPPKSLKKSKSTFDGLRLPPPNTVSNVLPPPQYSSSSSESSNQYPPYTQYNQSQGSRYYR